MLYDDYKYFSIPWIYRSPHKHNQMYFPLLYSEKYQKTITFMQQANLYIIYTAETTKLLFKSTLATLHEPPLYLKRDRRYPHLALPVGM